MRCVDQSAMADGARDVGSVAARAGRRAGDGDHRSRAYGRHSRRRSPNLAAGARVLVTDRDADGLADTVERIAAAHGAEAVASTVADLIDVRDEAHSLRLALRRLASDPELRSRLGRAAMAFWEREHSLPRMLDDYRRVIARAIAAPVPDAALPRHLRASGTERLSELLRPFGLAEDVWSRI